MGRIFHKCSVSGGKLILPFFPILMLLSLPLADYHVLLLRGLHLLSSLFCVKPTPVAFIFSKGEIILETAAVLKDLSDPEESFSRSEVSNI